MGVCFGKQTTQVCYQDQRNSARSIPAISRNDSNLKMKLFASDGKVDYSKHVTREYKQTPVSEKVKLIAPILSSTMLSTLDGEQKNIFFNPEKSFTSVRSSLLNGSDPQDTDLPRSTSEKYYVYIEEDLHHSTDIAQSVYRRPIDRMGRFASITVSVKSEPWEDKTNIAEPAFYPSTADDTCASLARCVHSDEDYENTRTGNKIRYPFKAPKFSSMIQ